MSHMEKPNQILYIWLVRADIDTVNINCSQHVFKLIKTPRTCVTVLVSKFLTGCIDKNDLTGLGIGKFNQSGPAKGDLRPVSNRDGNDIMTLVEKTQWFLEAGFDKIGHKKHGRSLAYHLGEIIQGLGNIGSPLWHFEIKQLANQP